MAEEKKEEAKKEEGKKEEVKKEEGKDPAAEGAGGAEGAPAEEGGSPLSKKKKMIIIGVAALAVLIIMGAGVFFVIRAQKTEAPEQVVAETEGKQGEEKEGGDAGESAENSNEEASKPIFIDMPEFLINLNSAGKQASFLKMVVVLDVPDEKSKQALEANMPRIRDNFQIYLHELRAEDLKGSAGLQLLREELLLRVNKVIYPQKVNDILFKEVLIQ